MTRCKHSHSAMGTMAGCVTFLVFAVVEEFIIYNDGQQALATILFVATIFIVFFKIFGLVHNVIKESKENHEHLRKLEGFLDMHVFSHLNDNEIKSLTKRVVDMFAQGEWVGLPDNLTKLMTSNPKVCRILGEAVVHELNQLYQQASDEFSLGMKQDNSKYSELVLKRQKLMDFIGICGPVFPEDSPQK